VAVDRYTPGVTQFLRNNILPGYVEVARKYEGYPEPNSIWDPFAALELTANFNSCSFADSSAPNPSMSTNMKSRLNTELLQKAGRRQVNYGEALGESRETVKMLIKAVVPLTKALLAARKGNFSLAAYYLGIKRLRNQVTTLSLSERWLSLQYGWLPLVNDIYDSYQLLQKGLDTRPQILSATRSILEEVSNTISKNDFTLVRTTGTVRYIVKMWYRMKDEDASILHQIGLINPAEVVWALVPFSFVVDWVLPIGNVLEALSARLGLSFVDGYYGLRVETNCVAAGLERSVSGYTQNGPSSCSVSGSLLYYNRSKMTGLPWPAPYIKSPFSSTHLANAAALLRTLRIG